MDDMTARRLGKYYLLDVIGRGGMAEIYRAKTFDEDGRPRIVAIKRILPTAMNDELIRMLIDEARIATLINHPSVARVYEFWQIQNEYILVMEYVDGKDLRTLLERHRRMRQPVKPEHAAYIAIQVLEGLYAAHNQVDRNGNPLNLVHRDVSPSNILISYDGDVKLCDFGIAKANLSSTKTKAGIVKGKAKYMSPEQAMGKKLDARSDLFSLGIVLYEMLTLVPPFYAKSEIEMLMKVRDGRFMPLRTRNPAVPPMLQRIVHKALRKDLSRRYQDAMEFADDLREFLKIHAPKYTKEDLSRLMREVFAREIEEERKRLAAFEGLEKTEDMRLEGINLIEAEPVAPTKDVLDTTALEDAGVQPAVNPDLPLDIYSSATVILGDEESAEYLDSGTTDPLEAPTELLQEATDATEEMDGPTEEVMDDAVAAEPREAEDWEEIPTETDKIPAGVDPELLEAKTHILSEEESAALFDSLLQERIEEMKEEGPGTETEELDASDVEVVDEGSPEEAEDEESPKAAGAKVMRQLLETLHITEEEGETGENALPEEAPDPMAAALSPEDAPVATPEEEKALLEDGGLGLEEEEEEEDEGDFIVVLTRDDPVMPVDREHAPVVLGEIELDSEHGEEGGDDDPPPP